MRDMKEGCVDIAARRYGQLTAETHLQRRAHLHAVVVNAEPSVESSTSLVLGTVLAIDAEPSVTP